MKYRIVKFDKTNQTEMFETRRTYTFEEASKLIRGWEAYAEKRGENIRYFVRAVDIQDRKPDTTTVVYDAIGNVKSLFRRDLKLAEDDVIVEVARQSVLQWAKEQKKFSA